MSEITEQRQSPGRRATDGEVVAVVEASFLRRFAGWFVAGGVVFCFSAGVAFADLRGRVKGLEEGQFTREEAAALRNAVDLLNAQITFLRSDLNRLENRR